MSLEFNERYARDIIEIGERSKSNSHRLDAVEEDVQVVRTPVNDRHRCIQQLQHGAGDQGTEDHDDHRGNKRQGNAVADVPGQTIPVPGTEVLGDHDACAGGNTHEQGQQQVQNGGCAANSGQGVVTHIHTDDDGIGGVVQLLGNIADQHGQRELNDFLPRGTFGHIRGGEQTLKTQRKPLLTYFFIFYFNRYFTKMQHLF